MAKRKSRLANPLLFTPWPVTFFVSLLYLVLFAALLAVHLTVPHAPEAAEPVHGLNLTEAWVDLQELTAGFRPYNSRRNDEVRDWILRRIETIMAQNGVAYSSDRACRDGMGACDSNSSRRHHEKALSRDHDEHLSSVATPDPAVIFNDLTSNLTYAGNTFGPQPGTDAPQRSIYFEGTNVVVYIRGTEDDVDLNWSPELRRESISTLKKSGGVLVNAHYDSVSTGFGATDDGMGVVSVLQLIRYFTTPGNTPRRGVVALLNNGEEDSLNGAAAYSQHPTSHFVTDFLNLEGAGAGGRATLFRSTDAALTRAYAKSPYPFGNVMSQDGFERGLIRSQTDYVVLHGGLGLRGLDVAFLEPRARYHTDQDDSRHTSRDSLWHMLSAALTTTQELASKTDIPRTGKGGLFFDMFGRSLAVLKLNSLFAICVTLLVASPIVNILVLVALARFDKMYLFSSKAKNPSSEDVAKFKGLRGLSRFFICLVVSSVAVLALALLVTKVNPFIVYSSPYAVWPMILSAWVVVMWFLLSACDFVRPSAFQRVYALLWLFLISWILLVVFTVYERRLGLAGGYFLVIYFAAVSVATLISLLELFALPRKLKLVGEAEHDEQAGVGASSGTPDSSTLIAPSADENTEAQANEDEQEEATESTSLLGRNRFTFANYTRSGRSTSDAEEPGSLKKSKAEPMGQEQSWSGHLPKWTWLLQVLVLVPINVIVVGQIALLFTSGMYQTGADGSSSLLVYLAIAIFSIFLLAPAGPFIHRFTYHVPTFLFFIFVGTLIYNLVAFPFSPNNRLKVYFEQTVDLDSGINEVSLVGVEEYVRNIVRTIPSASGQEIKCGGSEEKKRGLRRCRWRGLAPNVVPRSPGQIPPEKRYGDWVVSNMTRLDAGEARISLFARESRACRLLFNSPISDFHVEGAGHDERFKHISEHGSQEIRLWSREWEKPWNVTVKWGNTDQSAGSGMDEQVVSNAGSGGSGLDGRIVCLWSDYNQLGTIPALDELKRYGPEWAAFSKLDDGLVEGHTRFMI